MLYGAADVEWVPPPVGVERLLCIDLRRNSISDTSSTLASDAGSFGSGRKRPPAFSFDCRSVSSLAVSGKCGQVSRGQLADGDRAGKQELL